MAQDHAEAVKWLRRIAERGNVYAQNDLGECYRNGGDVMKSKAEAAKWFRLAAEQGNAAAKENLEKLERMPK